MGNKHIQAGTQGDSMDECANEEYLMDEKLSSDRSEDDRLSDLSVKHGQSDGQSLVDVHKDVEQKSKPYKPRFHQAKMFFEESKLKENDAKLDNIVHTDVEDGLRHKVTAESQENCPQRTNPDLLKLRINELINKNNSIVNCDEAVVLRRRNIDNYTENTTTNNNNNINTSEYIYNQTLVWTQQYQLPPPPSVITDTRQSLSDEPLNLTSKNRKRCLSDSTDNTQKSLIKELLLKNLSQDPNLQCPYCKMIFQTVTELEMHKLKYCNAKSNTNIRYARSSSVNVASILTQNKNAFDNIPHMQHTTFPLKSPGPCLGKTRLIENDRSEKYRTFSFDDNVILHHTQSDAPSFNKYMLHSPVGYPPLSPQVKKNTVKLFGGEVKITQTSGETRSFKIESESINKLAEPTQQTFMEFTPGGNLSENLVISKSSLQSGGTVLQNKANYSPKRDALPSPNIRVYDNAISPSLNLPLLKESFTFDRPNDKLLTIANTEQMLKRSGRDKLEHRYDNGLRSSTGDNDKDKELYKSNLIDFGQKAVKLLAPNLKPPNLTIPGLPIPSAPGDKLYHSPTVTMAPLEITTLETPTPVDNQHLENLNFAKKQISLQQRMAEVSQPQHVYNPMNLLVNGKVIRYVPGIPGPIQEERGSEMVYNVPQSPRLGSANKYPNKDVVIEPRTPVDEPTTPSKTVLRSCELSPSKSTSPIAASTSSAKEESRRFIRPTSLALKPNSNAFKSHHGLTPTMFNQALISPDTPRVAKKYCQQYLNGNYFSYLGLKSSTKSVYCTLNKTQPFYVKHFKKLSMYSEWRQQESKIDSLSVSAYDSCQRGHRYTMAGSAKADLIVHSSYKFVTRDSSTTKDDSACKNSSVLGGYESNEDYTYIRGRGRGRYVCDQCGIRCKKPSMLKKHIRTHSDDRPYTCEHCNFSFKTKGNLTKHMKSKAHSKKYAATSNRQTNGSTSSETEDSDADSSDESTRLQEHEAAHCLLSLAQKNTTSPPLLSNSNSSASTTDANTTPIPVALNLNHLPSFLKDDKFLKNPDQINHVTNANFAKNKILDETSTSFSASKHLTEMLPTTTAAETNNITQFLGKSIAIRPLTYPYLQSHFELDKVETSRVENSETGYSERSVKSLDSSKQLNSTPVIRQNEFFIDMAVRKRKLSTSSTGSSVQYKLQRHDSGKMVDLEQQQQPVLDLSPACSESVAFVNGGFQVRRANSTDLLSETSLHQKSVITNSDSVAKSVGESETITEPLIIYKARHNSFSESNSSETFSQNSDTNDRFIGKSLEAADSASICVDKLGNSEQDQSAMQTLAEIATKQVKLEKNILAKNVASEYLKLASNCEGGSGPGTDTAKKYSGGGKDAAAELIVKPEESKSCSICSKNFSKPSQLRLHMNIHYLERPFRCETCSVSFRTKGHLQKHERSASHHNKLSSSPALSSSEPRPFKCTDCNIAFRIHGHLAKHLRSKMHIMKLECLAKIPFGLYAELERANSLLTEINTTDGDLCLESLKILARKLFNNDPNKLDQLVVAEPRDIS
ncbi:schnurri [Carabus blaptoides fortunei]